MQSKITAASMNRIMKVLEKHPMATKTVFIRSILANGYDIYLPINLN